ncbi:hypothetical protein EGY16_29385 [Burkholderia pseudomallei]|nr:hypothetical protein EGY16_29385 [Burkholderia pseudomallei]
MSASCSRFSRALPVLYPHLAHALRGFADDRRCMTRSERPRTPGAENTARDARATSRGNRGERPSAATATPKAGSSARIERARACG